MYTNMRNASVFLVLYHPEDLPNLPTTAIAENTGRKIVFSYCKDKRIQVTGLPSGDRVYMTPDLAKDHIARLERDGWAEYEPESRKYGSFIMSTKDYPGGDDIPVKDLSSTESDLVAADVDPLERIEAFWDMWGHI